MKELPQDQATIPGRPILSYFRRLFVAVDQLLNVILGGDGAGSDYSGAGGGGGSSYFDPARVTNAQLLAGLGTTPGNASDPARNGAGSTLSGRLILA